MLVLQYLQLYMPGFETTGTIEKSVPQLDTDSCLCEEKVHFTSESETIEFQSPRNADRVMQTLKFYSFQLWTLAVPQCGSTVDLTNENNIPLGDRPIKIS